MINKLIFIDTENIHEYIFLKAMKLTSKDKVIFVCSSNTPNVSAGNLEPILKLKCKTDFIKTSNASKNYMDFVIISALTEYCCSEDKPNHCIVISKDKGYTAGLSYISERFNVKVSRIGVEGLFINLEDPSVSRVFTELSLSEDDFNNVLNCLKLSKTLDDLSINLSKRLGSKGACILDKIRPFIPLDVFKN